MRTTITAVLILACVATLNAHNQKGTIVFYREPHALTGNFKPALFCDGKRLARIENGTFFDVTANAGIYTCTVESLRRPGAIDVDVIAGRRAYVHVKLIKGWKDHAQLANTTEDEFNKQRSRMKPLKEWTRAELDRAAPNAPPPTAGKPPKNKRSGRFGDLALSVTKLVMAPAKYSRDRDELATFITVRNTGKDAICAELGATLKTTFGLQYRGVTSGDDDAGFPPAPRMNEMLPGESATGSYVFDIKDGVKPLQLVITLESRQYDTGADLGSIRCGSGRPLHDLFIPGEIRLDVHDLPVNNLAQ